MFAGRLFDSSSQIPNRDFVATRDAQGIFTLQAIEGTQISGAQAGWLAGRLDSPVITDLGVGYEVEGITGGPPVGMDSAYMLNGSILLRSGVHVPSGQFTGANEAWENFDFSDFDVSRSSTKWLMQGDLTGAASRDGVLVISGTVALQESFPIPGGPVEVIDRFHDSVMMDSGDWCATGYLVPSFDEWAVLNGTFVGRQNTLIFPGATESWINPFDFIACNNVGDYVIAGDTSAWYRNNSILLLNGQLVVCREGQPIDFDGNGLFDDEQFVSKFLPWGRCFTDDGKVLTRIVVTNSNYTSVSVALVEIDLNGVTSTFCDPADPNSTGMPTRLTGTYLNGLEGEFHLEAFQGPPSQFGFVLVGAQSMDPGTAMGMGHLCLSGIIGRYNGPATVSNSIGMFDQAGVLQNLVEVWPRVVFQKFRDHAAASSPLAFGLIPSLN